MKKPITLNNLGNAQKEIHGWVPVGEIKTLKNALNKNWCIFNNVITFWKLNEKNLQATNSTCKQCGNDYEVGAIENKLGCKFHKKFSSLFNRYYKLREKRVIKFYKTKLFHQIIFILIKEKEGINYNEFEKYFNHENEKIDSLSLYMKFSAIWVCYLLNNLYGNRHSNYNLIFNI